MMRKIVYTLLFLWVPFCTSAQDEKQLPEIPWKDIVELHLTDIRNLKKWNSNINVELIGDYTKKDSLKVVSILNKLDSITETISINISSSEKSNYKIFFSDIFNSDELRYHLATEVDPSADELSPLLGQSISAINLIVRKKNKFKNNESIYDFLEVFIAKTLVSGYFSDGVVSNDHIIFRQNYYNLGEKIRLTGKYLENYNRELKIIEEIYKKDFYKRLKKADKIYEEDVKKELENKKILNRDRSLWWVKNPYAVIILPVLLFIIFSIYLLKKASTVLIKKLNNKWLYFLVLSLLVISLADVLIIFAVSTFDFITIPDDYEKSSFVRYDTVISTIMGSIFLIPVLFLYRLLELKIQEKVNSIFQKTALIFMSTGLLPFLLIYLFYVIFNPELNNSKEKVLSFTSHFDYNKQETYGTLAIVFIVLMLLAALRSLVSYFIFKERNLIMENENKLSQLRELKAKAELKSLQSQINPHFLYNSLNSIASLALVDASKTQQMAYSLSDLFKYSINRKGKKMSLITDEIEMVESYLSIEKIRFGDRLQYDIQVDETLVKEEIPLFLLQPLVENAVKHGISKNTERGEITLRIEKEKNSIVITVADNGPDFPEGLVSGHGLQTVFDLLRLSYGNNAKLNWTNTPEKQIVISIPKKVNHVNKL